MKKVNIIFLFYLIYIIELCCAYCHFLGLHSNHKIIPLNDIESLQKENCTLDTKELNVSAQKIITLKNKIENEINSINNLYDKTLNDLTQSFVKKHEELIKKENELKEKLQNEVTKVKEQLENFLSQCNAQIKNNEKINQGIKKLENNEKNVIKTLSYVSKVNKSQKEMKKLKQNFMKSIKFVYQEENSSIKYDEFLFNGIQIPNNIKFNDIYYLSLNLSWEIDDLNNINIDKNQIKFKVEMRAENGEFTQVYEGKNYNCSISNLVKNSYYEFRICSLYNDLKSPWSEIQKIKTSDLESDILNKSERKDEFAKKIFEWTGFNSMKLLYRGTKDGMNADTFHNKCDNQDKTLTLIKNDKGNIFGGYASIPWKSSGNWQNAPECFIFTLTNIHGTEPTKFQSKKKGCEVGHYSGNGPLFGDNRDIFFYSNFVEGGCSPYSNFPANYEDVLGKGKSIFTGEFDNNKTKFKIKEIEIFKLLK